MLKKRLVTDVFCTLGVRSGPNKMNPITEVRLTRQDTRSPSAAPNWLIDEQIIFINNSVTATALSAFVSWQQASADVIHALYVTDYCHLNNTSAITHALQSNAIDGASENRWGSLTLNTHVPLDLVGVKLSKALHMDTALALGLERSIAEPTSAVNNRHHLFLSIRDRGRNKYC